MAIEIVSLGEETKEYSFSARSLTEALEKMRRHGPEGRFGRCSIDVQYRSFDVNVEVVEGSSPSSWSAIASFSRGTIQYQITYLVPRWRNIGLLPFSIQTEWNRFMECLWIHERGHPSEEIPILEEYKRRFEELRCVGTGRSHREAAEAAGREIADQRMRLIEEIGRKREEARNRYDFETHHGEIQGVYLNLDIDRELQGSSRY